MYRVWGLGLKSLIQVTVLGKPYQLLLYTHYGSFMQGLNSSSVRLKVLHLRLGFRGLD